MGKGLILPGIFVVSLLTLALFHIKYKVVDLEDKIYGVNREIFKVEESINILEAEWAYRTSPRRISLLSEKHLPLTPIHSSQFDNEKINTELTSPPADLRPIAFQEGDRQE